MGEQYNGWANRETWATMLHLDNDEGLYYGYREAIESAIDGEPREDHAHLAADALREYVDSIWELGDECGWTEGLRGMRDDIGSIWRVDWDEMARAVLSDWDYGDEDDEQQ